jgi:hypothetical protein
MAKAPRPGLVKTRMCPPLTQQQAAELYSCMLDDVLEASRVHAGVLGLEPVVAVHPADALVEVADRAPPAFRVIAQSGGGLGARMDHAVREACAGGADRVLLRGSDNPVLSLAHVQEVARLLDSHDLVLTPDSDGGYGLVAVTRPWPGVFDHPMSTRTLLDETVSGARRRGLAVALSQACFDLDCVLDLRALDSWRRSVDDRSLCARTLDWLDEMGLQLES